MENREKLISLAVRYNGNYDMISWGMLAKEWDPSFNTNLKAITVLDEEYPLSLFDLNKNPFVLFYKGNLELLKEKDKIAILGCKEVSELSKQVTKDFIESNQDKVFVSGIEDGLSEVVHQTAEKSIAILEGDFDKIEIGDLNQKLILSEHPFETSVAVSDDRRLIAGFADEVIVMELRKHSSEMDTLSEAICFGKKIKIFNHPDNNLVANSKLIKQGIGEIF